MTKKNEEILKEALENFNIAVAGERDNRELALDDLKNLNGDQWPDTIRQERSRDKRPCITINHLPKFIKSVIGDQRQNRAQIKVLPVDNSGDPLTAQVISGLIRNIEYQSNAEIAYDTAFEQAVSCGFGFVRVLTEYSGDDSFDQEIRIKRIANQFSVYFDPKADEYDKSDARFCFVTETLSKKEFEERYPSDTPSGFSSAASGDLSVDWFGEDSVRVAEYWVKESSTGKIVLWSNGEVHEKSVPLPEGIFIVKEREVEKVKVKRYIISGDRIIEENDWAGKHIPIVPIYGQEHILEGRKIYWSLIRFAKDAQRMYNYWRTTITEQIALAPKAPYILTPEQIEGHEKMWGSANTSNLAYLLYNKSSDTPLPQRNLPPQTPTGAFTEAQVAVQDMQATTAIYEANLGQRSNEISGRAIMMRQREGDTASFCFIDNLARSMRQVGKILVDLIPRIYDTPRIVRIIGEEDKNEFIPINQSIEGNAGQLMKIDLTVGRYDVIIETGPSYATARIEAADSMMKFVQAVPSAAPIIGDLVAKNMDWPGAIEIAKRLKKVLPPMLQEGENGEPLPPEPPPPPDPRIEIERAKLDLEMQKLEVEKAKIANDGMSTEKFIREVVLSVLDEMYNPPQGG